MRENLAITNSVSMTIEEVTGHLTFQGVQSIGEHTPGQSGDRFVPFHMWQLIDMVLV